MLGAQERPAAGEVSVSRLVLLVVLVAAFTPAAVLGALPVVLPAVIAVTASLVAIHLALTQSAPEPVEQPARVQPPPLDDR